MAIYRIFERSAFQPEDTKLMGDAYEQALIALKLQNRLDPLTETIAQYVIEAAQTGLKDPAQICALAIDRIRNGK